MEISIDLPRQGVIIRDNGPGLSEESAARALVPIGHSNKCRESSRGFRGVGRLSGLAFADTVTFLTRCEGARSVTKITWNGSGIRKRVAEINHTDRSIRDCVKIEKIPANDFPQHFFEVQLEGIHRHAAGDVLNREVVRAYVAEVCPVPMSTTFPFAADVDRRLACERPVTVTVMLSGSARPLRRPFASTIPLGPHKVDQYLDFESFDIPSLGTSRPAGVGWIAHSSYLGVIPKGLGIRGLRARVGNIQIGGEDIFDHLFAQDRFNRWCIGEVHVMDHRIVPNGRRDYFEASPHTRNFENHLNNVARRIATRCRTASRVRNSARRKQARIGELEDWHSLATAGYLARTDAEALVDHARKLAGELAAEVEPSQSVADQFEEVRARLECFVALKEHSFGAMPASEVEVYQRVFRAVVDASRSPRLALEAIEKIAKSVIT